MHLPENYISGSEKDDYSSAYGFGSVALSLLTNSDACKRAEQVYKSSYITMNLITLSWGDTTLVIPTKSDSNNHKRGYSSDDVKIITNYIKNNEGWDEVKKILTKSTYPARYPY